MQGAQKDSNTTDSFGGVDELVDEYKLPKEFTPDARGGYFSEQNEFTRLLGKKLMPSTGGSVLAIQQLFFADRSVVVRHQGTRLFVLDDLSVLQSPEPVESPLEPFF